MNEDSIVLTQANSLIRQLRDELQRKTREIEREASAWCRERLGIARRDARIKVRAEIRVARERLRSEVAAAQAQLEAERRRRRQAELNGVLANIMRRVPDALAARWRNPNSRREWITAALRDAKRRLGDGDLTVRHAPNVMPDERVQVFEGLRLTWIEDAGLAAGLIIDIAGARLDASIEGLLAGSLELQSKVLKMLSGVSDAS